MTTKNRIRAFAVGTAMVLTLGACGLLDVNNPNNLVEADIHNAAAASAVVNGAHGRIAIAVSSIWQPYMVATDEMYWIGSRDAWLSLDNGFLSDPNNEFTDAAFPNLGEARWMADQADSILTAHVAESPTSTMKSDLARAQMYRGLIYMIIGEVQQDFCFSNKKVAGPPVGPDQMSTVLDDAIAAYGEAIAGFSALGETDNMILATALRARAEFSRAEWSKIKPSIASNPLVSSAAAVADAKTVLAAKADDEWKWGFEYSGSTVTNDMANWVNDRKENQFDLSVVTVNDAKDITGIALMDPIDNIPDPVITAKVAEWKGGKVTDKGDSYAPLDVVSARMMHLIIAEDALAGGDNATFTSEINTIRGLDGLTPYSNQMPALNMLEHERRVNLFLMGERLVDMYRFGIKDPMWLSGSDAMDHPGTLLPITIIEIRANPYLNGSK